MATCLVTGQVLNAAGNAFANGTITFDSVVGQTVGGNYIPASTAIATTDINGNINGGAGINLIQGLILRISLTSNGNMYAQWSALVPSVSSAGFVNLITSLGSVLALPSTVVTGTWTPAPRGDGSNPTLTGQTVDASYAQVGPIVWFSLHIGWSGASSVGTGNAYISGLPYTPLNPGTQLRFFLQIDNGSFSNVAYTQWCGYLNPNDSNIHIAEFGPGGGAGGVNLPTANCWVNAGSSNVYSYGVFRWQ